MRPTGGASILGAVGAVVGPKPPKPKSPVPFTAGTAKPPAAHHPAPKPPAAHRPAPKPVNPLAPLTPQQIRQQATKTITAAYAPNTKDLNNQQTQAQNLYHTQSSDDNAFQQWLSSQSQALNSQISTVNQKLTDVLTGIRGNEQSQFANAVPGAAQAVAGQPSAVTPASQLQGGEALGGLNPVVASEGAMSSQADANQAETAIAGNLHMANIGEVNTARVETVRNAQLGQLNKTLNSIAAERTKLVSARTGDIAKEIARLNGIEISKAQFNTNQAALEQKLGIAQQVANTGAKNANINSVRAAETARHNAAMEAISSTHYANADARAAAVAAETARHNKVTEAIGQQQANTSASRAAAAGAKVKGPHLTLSQKSAVSGYISTLRNALIDDINRYHSGDPRALSLAYHDITSGRYSKATGRGIGAPPLGADKFSYLNAATNTLTNYGASGLTPGDVDFLNGIGYGTGGYPVKLANKGTNPRQDASGQTIGQ